MKDSVIDIFERQSSFNFRTPSHQVNEEFNIFCYDTKKVFYTSLFWKLKFSVNQNFCKAFQCTYVKQRFFV